MSSLLQVLILEDRPDDAELLLKELRRAGFEPEGKRVQTEADYLKALETRPAVILADYTLPQFDALRALRLLHDRGYDIPFLVITGTIGEERAVECMREGATDYLLKDRLARLGPAVTRALGDRELREQKRKAEEELERLKERLQAENAYLQQEIKRDHNFDEILGRSSALKRMLHQVEQVAVTDTTVLILGETGTGKELVARAIHNLSPRRNRPLVKVNCAALPATLVESELFGHEKGAYTGATSRETGRFELADRGTLFLDEIGELPLELQAKLLRVLQDGEFQRVGSSRTVKVDVRLIAATNRDLGRAVATGAFRQDLYYRLNVFPLSVPPLRDRAGDIPLLVEAVVKKLARRLGKPIDTIPPAVMTRLEAYSWPGNVRELENVLERAVILATDSVLPVEELIEESTARPRTSSPDSAGTMEAVERSHILRVLEEAHGQIAGKGGAAERLGLKPGTLRSRMKKLGIQRSLPASDYRATTPRA